MVLLWHPNVAFVKAAMREAGAVYGGELSHITILGTFIFAIAV